MNYDSGNNDMLNMLMTNRKSSLYNNGFNGGNQALSNQNMQMANLGANTQSSAAKGWGGFMGATKGMQGQGGFVSGNNSIDDQTQQQMNGVTSSLNNIPIVGQFKAIGDMAEGIGGAIGGEKGANIVQGFTNPLGRQIEVFKNKNYSAGQKAIAALFPFASGFLKPKAVIDKPEEDKINELKDYQMNKIKENNFLKSSDFYKNMLNQ